MAREFLLPDRNRGDMTSGLTKALERTVDRRMKKVEA
jgi:hypothetical protein